MKIKIWNATWKCNFINRYINSNCWNQKAKHNTFKVLKKKNCQNRFLCQMKLLFVSEKEIRAFQTSQLRESASHRPLQNFLNKKKIEWGRMRCKKQWCDGISILCLKKKSDNQRTGRHWPIKQQKWLNWVFKIRWPFSFSHSFPHKSRFIFWVSS